MKKEKLINFDMDGTIVDLYGVNHWLESILSLSAVPYKVAKPLYKDEEIFPILTALKECGYTLNIITWSANVKDDRFINEVKYAKEMWLVHNNYIKFFDSLFVTKYGVPKHKVVQHLGTGQILVDDNRGVRDAWNLGYTINAKENIIPELEKLIVS